MSCYGGLISGVQRIVGRRAAPMGWPLQFRTPLSPKVPPFPPRKSPPSPSPRTRDPPPTTRNIMTVIIIISTSLIISTIITCIIVSVIIIIIIITAAFSDQSLRTKLNLRGRLVII